MFAVSGAENIATTIYLAINPEAAEQSEGKPSKQATKEHLIPERCEATDNQPVTVLMEPEFSKYEIICFKAKHKYKIEDLVKYRANSSYAIAYRERIDNLGKRPVEEGNDAYKTVVNPHLNRYWHEEGFVPALGMKEREKSKKDVLKAFIYAMGMDTFVRTRFENDRRDYWYLVSGANAIKVFSKGNAIGNGYDDLYNSLYFNRKWKNYILTQAKIRMKKIKGSLDADEMMEKIHLTTFIEDLVQSKEEYMNATTVEDGMKQTLISDSLFFDDEQPAGNEEEEFDENIFDIFLKMYPRMENGKWSELFEGLKLVLMEYLGFMLDGNAKLINQAYKTILNRMFAYSEPGKKTIERQYYVENGIAIPVELEPTYAEKKLRAHIQEIYKEKYFG